MTIFFTVAGALFPNYATSAHEVSFFFISSKCCGPKAYDRYLTEEGDAAGEEQPPEVLLKGVVVLL